jgi:hypothetical protein
MAIAPLFPASAPPLARLARAGLSALTLALCAACMPAALQPAEQSPASALPQPELLPIDDLLAEADRPGTAEAAIAPTEARLAALRARAGQMRQP